jgi:hypothetical protein
MTSSSLPKQRFSTGGTACLRLLLWIKVILDPLPPVKKEASTGYIPYSHLSGEYPAPCHGIRASPNVSKFLLLNGIESHSNWHSFTHFLG